MSNSQIVCKGCGAEASSTAQFCERCGNPVASRVDIAARPGDGAWSPPRHQQPVCGGSRGPNSAPGGSPPQPIRRPPAPRTDGHTRVVGGQVRGIETLFAQRSESNEMIWTFRVERYDEAGNRVQLVPVEMRGQAFEGSINDGDWVRAHGKFRAGTFRAKDVENVTTGAGIRAKRPPLIVRVILPSSSFPSRSSSSASSGGVSSRPSPGASEVAAERGPPVTSSSPPAVAG
jgi:hypothetical protein